MDVRGTVTISLEDYESLKAERASTEITKENLGRASKELQVFLSFLVHKENLDGHIEEFNKQSKTSKIVVENGRARIEFKDDKD
jgi:hypothetical protein